MNRFTKQLPALLSRTDVVLELRDSRLPLTSINNNLEGKLIFLGQTNIRSRLLMLCMIRILVYFFTISLIPFQLPVHHFVLYLIRS